MIKKLAASILTIGVLASNIKADELTALSQVVTYKHSDRLGFWLSNGNTNDNPPRGMSSGIENGWQYFIDNTMSKAIAAGFKKFVFYAPFGMARFIGPEGGPLTRAPEDIDDVFQFTTVQDCQRDLPLVVQTFEPVWSKFLQDHPDVEVTFGIGSLRTDRDIAAYLLGISPLEVDRSTLKNTIWPDGPSQDVCYDLPSYATDPQKLKTIYPDLIWPNIVPMLRVGSRRIIFDSASDTCGELSLGWEVGEKLRHPEKRDPVWDKMLIDAIGNDSVEVFTETRPDKGIQNQFVGYSAFILDDYYDWSDPDSGQNNVFIRKSLRNADLKNIYRGVRWRFYDPTRIATQLQTSDPADFINAKKGILAGHTPFIYPPWVLFPRDGIFADHGNKYGVSTLEDIFNVLKIDSIPTNIKLTAQGAGPSVEFIITRQPRRGSLTVDAKDSSYVTYKPIAGYNGPDSFSFKVRDGVVESDWATVYINPNNTASPADPGDQLAQGHIGLFKNVLGMGYEKQITIPLILEKEMSVKVGIYTRNGSLIQTLIDKDLPMGEHIVTWDGMDSNGRLVSAGTYFFQIELGLKTETRKIVVVR